MATDGRYKAICEDGEAACRLFDLLADPWERRDLGPLLPRVGDRLRAAVSTRLARTVTAERGSGRDAALERLARAAAGDPGVLGELGALLGDERAEVREGAARWLGERAPGRERASLLRLANEDPDPWVRAEAALALLRGGDRAMRPLLVRLLFAEGRAASPATPSAGSSAEAVDASSQPGNPASADLPLRAAVALAEWGEAAGERTLLEALGRATLSRSTRSAVIAAVGRLRLRAARQPLEALLSDETLRTVAARALGEIGDARARSALLRALASEPYPAARAAEARALVALTPRHDARVRAEVAALVARGLGDEEGLPDGVELLVALGARLPRDVVVLDLRQRRGWRALDGARCDLRGCVPGEGATVRFPRRAPGATDWIVVVRVEEASADATLGLAGLAPREVDSTPTEVRFRVSAESLAAPLRLVATGEVRLVAVAAVHAVDSRRAGGSAPPGGQAPPSGGVDR
jgi:HEAT repeat protein